jgi:hypothetical protein
MSVSMCVDAVKAQHKTVTRRHVNTWQLLKPGDRLTLIEKGMGLPKGAKQVVLAEVEVVDNRVERLMWINDDDVVAEGFPDMDATEFCDFWIESHHLNFKTFDEAMAYEVRRIEWRYVDA